MNFAFQGHIVRNLATSNRINNSLRTEKEEEDEKEEEEVVRGLIKGYLVTHRLCWRMRNQRNAGTYCGWKLASQVRHCHYPKCQRN